MGRDSNIDKIVIAGGGTAGWMAAAALANYFGDSLSITLVESEAIGSVGVGEATIPQIQLFNSTLGLSEEVFLKETGGTFKLGIEFDGWSRPEDRYFHGFGSIGRALGMLPFYQYWLRYQAEGGALSLDQFSANSLAAREGRFGVKTLRSDKGGSSKMSAKSRMAYAYHLDASLYAKLLRRYAEKRGVKRVEGRISGVHQHSENGHIRSLFLDNGKDVAGDLFLDCTGFRALLIGQVLESKYQDWSAFLPCNRALAVPTRNAGAPVPFTRATAREAGWQWQIPLQHRTGNGLVYCDEYVSDSQAEANLLENLSGEISSDPKPIKFTTGHRETYWKGNCIALGLASGFLEPLESTSIHMIQSGISRLVAHFPASNHDDAARAEYNTQTHFEYESLRDFLILHYRLNRRDGEFWRYCREMPIPDSLLQKIALFKEGGRINRFNTELFDVPSWLQVMLGQGLRPAATHPMVDSVSDADLADYIAMNARMAAEEVAGLPSHGDYIAQHCAART